MRGAEEKRRGIGIAIGASTFRGRFGQKEIDVKKSCPEFSRSPKFRVLSGSSLLWQGKNRVERRGNRLKGAPIFAVNGIRVLPKADEGRLSPRETLQGKVGREMRG
jgi:hypothetical protein